MVREKAERLECRDLMNSVALTSGKSVHGSTVMVEGLWRWSMIPDLVSLQGVHASPWRIRRDVPGIRLAYCTALPSIFPREVYVVGERRGKCMSGSYMRYPGRVGQKLAGPWLEEYGPRLSVTFSKSQG